MKEKTINFEFLFGGNIHERKRLKYINPDIYNENKNNVKFRLHKEYIQKTKSFII